LVRLTTRIHGRRRATGPHGAQSFQFRQHLVERLTLNELHDVVVQPVLFAYAEHRHDVGVVQPRGAARFALEALNLPAVERAAAAEHFQGHAAAERFLFRFVDDAHAAAADFPQDAEIAQVIQRRAHAGPRPVQGRLDERLRVARIGPDLFHHHQGGKERTDLIGQLGELAGVLFQCRGLSAPPALDELFSQLFDRVAAGIGCVHGDVLTSFRKTPEWRKGSPSAAPASAHSGCWPPIA
jgi:hypothetical protein